MRKKITAILLCLAIIVAATACANEAPQANNVGDDGGMWYVSDGTYIATLGEHRVPATTYAYFFLVYRNNWSHSAMMAGHHPDDFWNLEEDGLSVRQMLLDEVLRVSKEYAGLYRIAAAAGFEEPAESGVLVEAQLADLLNRVGGDETLFRQNHLITPAQMREAMRQANVVISYFNTTMNAIPVSDQELRQAFDSAAHNFERVTVRHILIAVEPDMTEEEQAEAAELAESILARIRDGEEIGALAAIYSDDDYSRYRDGQYTFGWGEMVEEFEQWAFEAQPGDTGIVRTARFGYHIMQKISGTGFETLDEYDLEELRQTVRFPTFERNHSELYDMLDSDDWIVDQALIDKFAEIL